MEKLPHTHSTQEQAGSRIGQSLKRFAGRSVVTKEAVASQFTGSSADIEQARNGLPERAHLDKGEKRRINLHEIPLTKVANRAGGESRLMSLIFARNAVVGVVGIADSENQLPSKVSLMLLPYGEHKPQTGNGHNTAKRLATFDFKVFTGPRADGTIQGWEKYTLGRASTDIKLAPNAVISEDTAVSRQHASLLVEAGSVEVTDESQNGTQVLKIEDLMSGKDVGEPAMNLYEDLYQNPWKWSPDYADGPRVVSPS